MDNLITRTKIVPPRRRADLFTRPRLLELLHELLDYKLIILVAPAGYGKTVLLVDFAHNTEFPVCWYALDTLDQDPYRFFAYFITAIAQRFPDFGRASLAALQSMTNDQGSIEQLVTMVVNDLYEHVQEHFVFVIDDYHLVDENETISNFISQFVQQVDENCHLVLASRKLLGIPDMALMIARGYVGGLDFEDLVFAKEEIQQLVLKNYGKSLTDQEATALLSATEGWITGLLLSTQSKLRNISGRMRIMRAAGIDLYDYLAQQVLDQQSPAIREFLLRTAVLGEFDAALCTAVFEPTWLPPDYSWEMLVGELSQRNLFVLPVGEDGAVLRYHPLFQEFLQKKLLEERPEEETQLVRRLATIYVEQKAWEKAHQLYKQLDDQIAVGNLIEHAGLALLNAGRVQLLESWLTDLPIGFTSTRPVLLTLSGEVLSRQGNVEQAVLLFNQAEQVLREQPNVLGLAQTLVRRAIAQRLLGSYQASIEDTDQVLSLLAMQDEQAEDLFTLKALALRSKGLSLSSSGKFDESLIFLQQALQLFQTIGDAQNIANLSIDIAIIYCARTQNAKARPLFQAALDVWRKLTNVAAQAIVLNNLGVLFHTEGNYNQALAALEEAYLCAERSGYTRFVVFALASLGDLFIDLEMWNTAQSLYHQALTIAERIHERFLLIYLELALAKVANAHQNWKQVFERLDVVSKLALDRNSGYEWGLYQLAIGRYYLAQTKPHEAIDSLLDAQTLFAEGGQPVEEAITLFLLAIAYGPIEPTKQQTYLTQGLQQTFALESRHPLITALRPIKTFLSEVSTTAANRVQIQHLLYEIEVFEQTMPTISRQLRQLLSPTLAALLVDIPPKLTIRVFGRAEVLVAGKPISTSEWQTQVARDLFFCLLAHEDGLTKEQVSTLFWPDASPSEVKTRFKNAMYRLRNALAQEVILFEDEIYRFNRMLDYDYDLENFLQKVAEGDAASDPASRIAAYTVANQTYRGPYLPDVTETWVWPERERLQRIFTETSLTLANLQFDIGDYNAALASCQRILVDDPCLEDAHRLAMRIHAAMGNRIAIARQYAQCQRALSEEIDAPPSPQTEALYAMLMR